MCTVSFIPTAFNDFVLTSNRDEAPSRQTIPPQKYAINGVDMIFPKDKVAGGTWFGLSERKRLICLLNGGFTAHKREASYKKSRGIVVTELLAANDVKTTIANYDFIGIEPFTIIMVDWEGDLKLFEFVWDGTEQHFTEKPIAPQIWSSSLLYSEENKAEREQWFSNFLFEHVRPNAEDMLAFHTEAGIANPETNLIMDRGFVKTTSITQISKKEAAVSMHYDDLQTQLITTIDF